MINNLLEFSRVTSASKVFEPTDLNEVLKATLSDLEVTIQKSKATIEIDDLPVIDANPTQLSQLFLNLISNSLKFKNADKAPIITIDASLFRGHISGMNPQLQYHVLSFEDNGIGFDQKHALKIFEVFQRLHTKDSYEGTGIGLSIVKKIVDNHDGLITAESTPGLGAKFIIYLPVRP